MSRIVSWVRATLASSPTADSIGRNVEVPVSPTDGLVIARGVAVLALALYALSSGDGDVSRHLALVLLIVAVVQPVLPLFGRNQETYRHVQVVSDLTAFLVVVFVAPAYFWPAVVVLASVIANYAVLTSMRRYVPVALMSVAVVGATGEWVASIESGRAAGTVAILAIGHGFVGFRTRRSMSEARVDVLDAVRAAGGITHLSDLETGKVIDVAGDVAHFSGWSLDQWVSMDLRGIVHPDDVERFWIDKDEAEPGDSVDRTGRIRRPDGSWIWIRDVSRVVLLGGSKHIRGFSIDVTAAQDGLAKITNEASTDELTGLPNRRALLTALTQRSDDDDHHLVLIDLDGFKDVNDTLGHDAGDELLEVVADRLSTCLRPTDLLARLGGDEFAIVIDGAGDTSAVTEAVERFGFEVGRPIEISGVLLTVSISAGIVAARVGSSDPLTMLRHADISMYAAKRSGRRSMVFDAELEEMTDRRAALAGALAGSLESGELALQFQPIVDVVTGAVTGLEGLARWDHPDFGMLKPAMFLDVVLMSEQSGEFTRRMVGHALDAAAGLNEAGLQTPVSVNLPVRVLEDPDFVDFVRDRCAERGVGPDLLVFEIAERDIHDTDSITSAIDRMVALGATISVDDFGAGHATFERLRWRNVDQLKLDGEAIRHAVDRQRDRAILRSVLDLAADLGYSVVAEGVETEEQLSLLRSLGCPLAQGFLFSDALPLSESIDYACQRRVDA